MADKRGGTRSNSGRKRLPESERRTPIRLYPQIVKVEALGGEKVLKEKLNGMIDSMYHNKVDVKVEVKVPIDKKKAVDLKSLLQSQSETKNRKQNNDIPNKS